jgi:hypothetical protein
MWVNILLKAILFMLMVPGVHFSIPPGGSLREKAIIHGVVFAVLNYFVYMYIRPLLERFDNPDTKVDQPCPHGSKKGKDGECVLEGDVHNPRA